MTYLEKYMQEHPDADEIYTIHDNCPPGMAVLPSCCNSQLSCEDCWKQEIPGTEKTEEPKKCMGLSYEEKQKLLRFVLELSDEERDHLLDYINALDELAHKQEMADNICERFLNCERKDV